MVGRGPSVHQTSYRLACDVLRDVLWSAFDSGCGDRGAIGSVPYRAVVTLYMLLMGHPVDRRGRCRSCRRPRAVFGRRWRRCRVYGEASVWLHQSAEFVGSQLARELGLVSTNPVPGADAPGEEATDRAAPADLVDTEVLPRVAADPESAPITAQSPVVSPSVSLPGGFPGAGRPVVDHGGAGERPERPRSRRGPSDDQRPPMPDRSLLVFGALR